MTKEEFQQNYKKLADLYPSQFASKDKAQALANEVKDLSGEWFEKLVNKIIVANDPFMKYMPLIEAEKRRVNQEFSTSEQAKDFEEMRKRSTPYGLEALKRQHGAESAWDLVEKMKGKGA